MKPTTVQVRGQLVRLSAPLLPRPTSSRPQQEALPLPELPAPATPRPRARQDQVDRLVQVMGRALLETLQGRRSPGQASHWMTEDCHRLLMAWARQRDWSRTAIASVRSCLVSPQVVEASVQLHDQHHFCALMRLEHGYGRWRITVFQVMLPPAVAARCA